MNKLYNTQKTVASAISNFLQKVIPNIRKTQLKIIPFIVLGMIFSESCVAHDIAKNLKDDFAKVQFESVTKRIKRFFTNKLFDPYKFYDAIIKYVVSNYKKKHTDKRVHIVFDHMFSHENFTVFMVTFRVGKIGVPLWFRCFKGTPTEAFVEELLMEGIITYASNLFNSYEIIFLADRWFGSVKLMKHIESLGHTYCMRLKKNIKVVYEDPKTKEQIITKVGSLKGQFHNSSVYKNVFITSEKYKTNVVISKKKNSKEPWIIVTNKDTKNAVRNYRHRFGGIECVFKNQKSNGFYLESTVNASLKYFESMYTMVCFATLYLTTIGSDYSKNTACYKKVNIKTHKMVNGVKTRILSLFNVGLTLFKRAFNSCIYIRIPFSFILYDV